MVLENTRVALNQTNIANRIYCLYYGLPDRDVILQGVVEPQTKSKRYVTLKVKAMPDFMAANHSTCTLAMRRQKTRVNPC